MLYYIFNIALIIFIIHKQYNNELQIIEISTFYVYLLK